MIWTMLSFGIIIIWVLGMILAAKLTDKSSRLASGAGLEDDPPSGRRLNPQGAEMIK